MPHIPDFTDPRYLDEVGWFLFHARYERGHFGGSYDAERLAYSKLLMDEVLGCCGQEIPWLADKTVCSVGSGCTGDLAAWPAAVKIAVDPLLYTYQQLGLLLDDIDGTSRTIHLTVGIEAVPVLDKCADLVVCRNALDHMPDPERGLQQIWRILKDDGCFFVSVDLGGVPTPDEPTVFSIDSLGALMQDYFEILTPAQQNPPHSPGRVCSVCLLARKRWRATPTLDREQILQAYIARVEQGEEEARMTCHER